MASLIWDRHKKHFTPRRDSPGEGVNKTLVQQAVKNRESVDDKKRLRQRLTRIGKKTSGSINVPPSRELISGADRFGEPIETPHGPAFVIEERYSFDHSHGNRQLGEYFGYTAQLAAEIARDASLADVDLGRMLFVDTETTGLVGGAGTLAFLIGIGAFEENEFILRQFLLHDPGEEAAMLYQIDSLLDSAEGFVSFNGRVFDVPLVEMRLRMSLRKRASLTSWPHLDLLFPARRLWKRTLPNCTLGTLETRVLGVQRSGEDVPGEWIPGIYLDYLRTGDTSELKRVVYHNTVDILSLVGLSVEILSRHESDAVPDLTGAEALGVARWHDGAGRGVSAEQAYRAAVKSDDLTIQVDALRHWAAHLKRGGQRESAIAHWEHWHELAPDDPRPCVELAKYFEWDLKDLERAAEWSQHALACLSYWPSGWRREQVWAEIKHRISRIEQKLARIDSSTP